MPSERLEGTPYARELSALDRSLMDVLEQTDPQTLRAIARWAARRACEEAGYGDNEQIAGVLDRMDRGAGWFETLDGPPPPVESRTEPVSTIAVRGFQAHGWLDDRAPIENTAKVITPTFNEDPFHAAVETVWLATGPFVDNGHLLTELRERFLTNPAP